MASKGVKSQLKAAKAALGKKDYQEAERICQEIFAVDEDNYTAHVFAGLAALELGRYRNAKEHYKSAVASQPTEQLAWKGLANFYDKCSPGLEDVQDAAQTYQTLLTFPESDLTKRQSTLKKLAGLWRQLGDSGQVVHTYSTLLETYGGAGKEGGGQSSGGEAEEVAELWRQLTNYLLGERSLSESAWEMMERGVEHVLGQPSCGEETMVGTREKYVQQLLGKYKVQQQATAAQELAEKLWEQCHILLQSDPSCLPALTASAHLSLVELLGALPGQPEGDLLPEWKRKVLEQFYQMRGGEEGGEPRDDEGLSCVGVACVRVLEGRWREARTLAVRGLSVCTSFPEAHLLLTFIHLRLHDYSSAQQQADTGLKAVSKIPPFLEEDVQRKLKLFQAQALLSMKETVHSQQALSLLTNLSQVMSGDCHVTVALARAHLALGEVEEAEKVVQALRSAPAAHGATAHMLQGEICLAKEDYQQALHCFDSALQQQPSSAECLFLKGLTLWGIPDSSSKVQAYSTLLQAAKADPFNPDVFVYIGHYQRLVAGDISRAIKCYQKAVDLQPAHIQALNSLGDALFVSGDEDTAFRMYTRVTAIASTAKGQQAWLRLGLYYRKRGQFTEAIKSFQSALASDTNNKQCWECLAEAYLARGSHSSALRAFSKVVELDPKSIYCLYQLANIRQLLGELRGAVEEYSSVLEVEPSYMPALKGRGHAHFLLALSSLKENFDGKAVDHVSAALADLTRAASLKPKFLCVWKLIGDCCTCLHQVAPRTARPVIPEVLLGKGGSVEDTVTVEKVELFHIGCKAYGKALQLSPDSSSLWHDLSLSYYHLAEMSSTAEKRREHMGSALNAIKKAVSLSPTDHTHWNALGVIAAHSAVCRPALAQHSFIKSIQLEANNALAWTNTGALYLQHGQMELAHKSFQTAQSLDPGYAAAWIGQAVIAHNIGHSDCMDLFRHTTELAYHNEGSRGYAYWVCHTLATLDRKLILERDGVSLKLVAQAGLLRARDCLQKCVERETEDVWVLNLLGLLYEQEGLLSQAEKTFSRAAQVLGESPSPDASQWAAVNSNWARVLSARGKASLSLEVTSSQGPPSDLPSQLQLALTLFRAQRFSESLQAYEHALQTCEEKHKSSILSAAAMVAFAQEDTNKAKTYLFQAFQAQPPCLHGLVGLIALGCLQGDLTLGQATVQEMLKILEWQDQSEVMLHHSCVVALKTSRLLMENQQALECADAITKVLQLLPEAEVSVQAPSLPLTLPYLSRSDPPSLRASAQRLVHSYPSDVWSLAVLMHSIEQEAVKNKYRAVVLQYSQSGPSHLSCSKATMQPATREDLLHLQHWLQIH